MKDESIYIKEQNPEKINNSASTQNVRNSNPNLFSKDFLYFKNDILKELNEINKKLENQKKLNANLKDLISSQDLKLLKFKDKLENFSNIINDKKAVEDYDNNKINELMNFKSKIESSITSCDCKIKINSDEIKYAINKYDKIISDNLVLPGIIGRDTKFKDLRDLLQFILNQIKIFSAYKEKNSVDLKSYKTKLDSMINSLNFQISSITGTANSFTTSNLKVVEKKCLDEIKAFDEKIMKIRVESLESIKNFEKDKNKIFEEWGNLKNMKQELIELINSSIKKVNSSNNQMKITLDNFEKQFNDIKNSMTELYGKMKKENKENNNEEKQDIKNDIKVNNERIDIYNLPSTNNEKAINNEKSINNTTKRVQRIQSSKTVLQNYIEGNSVYQELMEQNSLRCKKHESSEQSVHSIMKKYYDEGFYSIKDKNIYRTIESNIPKNNSPITDRNNPNNTLNITPKSNFNLNNIKKNFEDNKMNDIDAKRTIQHMNKNRNHSSRKKIILMKEGNIENNSSNKYKKNNKIKLKDAEKRLLQQEKITEHFIDKRKMYNIKQLSSISFLYEDIKNKKFPKLDKNENNKEDELFFKNIKNNKKINKNKIDHTFLKEYNALSGSRVRGNNPNSIKIRQRINSSEFIKHNNYNEIEKDNSSSIFNIYNEYMPEKNKKIDEENLKKDSLIKKAIYKLKNEAHK